MKKKVIDILVLILALSLVLYFSLKDNFNQIIIQLKSINIPLFILAIIVLIIALLFKALGLRVFLKEYKEDYSIKDAFNITIIAQFLNAITPFQTGGQPFQIHLLKKEGIRITDSTSALLKDFIAFQSALILVGVFAILANIKVGLFSGNSYLDVLVLLGFIVNLVILFILIFVMTAKKNRLNIINKFINFIFKFRIMKKIKYTKEQAINGLEHFYEVGREINKKNLFKAMVFHVINLSIMYIIPLIIFYSINVKGITILECYASTAFVMLIGNFIPIPGATGGIEYSFVQFFGHFVKGPALYSGMILWRTVTYIFGIIIGAISLMIRKGEEKKCE